uniref:Uncharacterized protein n=1 Tax=Arundo donax TaxID=35708 RepID=A0A0A8Z0L2_ARUDO
MKEGWVNSHLQLGLLLLEIRADIWLAHMCTKMVLRR